MRSIPGPATFWQRDLGSSASLPSGSLICGREEARAPLAGGPCGLTELTGKARGIKVPAPGRSTADASYPSLHLSFRELLVSLQRGHGPGDRNHE